MKRSLFIYSILLLITAVSSQELKKDQVTFFESSRLKSTTLAEDFHDKKLNVVFPMAKKTPEKRFRMSKRLVSVKKAF